MTSKRTGYLVGPGSYDNDNSTIKKKVIPGGNPYKSYHNNKDMSTNGYYMIGHHMIFDGNIASTRIRSSLEDTNFKFDSTALVTSSKNASF